MLCVDLNDNIERCGMMKTSTIRDVMPCSLINLLTFQRIVIPPSSQLKETSKSQKACHLLLTG
jgi:hypothetical protein